MNRYRICFNGKSCIVTDKIIVLSNGDEVKSTPEISSFFMESLMGYDEIEIYDI